jgi:hypothetical protein
MYLDRLELTIRQFAQVVYVSNVYATIILGEKMSYWVLPIGKCRIERDQAASGVQQLTRIR